MNDDNLYSDTTVHLTSSIILFNAESFPLNITTEHSKNRCLRSELMAELIACVFLSRALWCAFELSTDISRISLQMYMHDACIKIVLVSSRKKFSYFWHCDQCCGSRSDRILNF